MEAEIGDSGPSQATVTGDGPPRVSVIGMGTRGHAMMKCTATALDCAAGNCWVITDNSAGLQLLQVGAPSADGPERRPSSAQNGTPLKAPMLDPVPPPPVTRHGHLHYTPSNVEGPGGGGRSGGHLKEEREQDEQEEEGGQRACREAGRGRCGRIAGRTIVTRMMFVTV
eukprot:jgi/Mesen1/639/ME000108S_10801